MNVFFKLLLNFASSLIVYFGLGWIVVNIYYAIFPYTISTDLTSLYGTTQTIYASTAFVYCIVIMLIALFVNYDIDPIPINAFENFIFDRLGNFVAVPFCSMMLLLFIDMSSIGSIINAILCVIAIIGTQWYMIKKFWP
jgi:hypothetical protein